MKKALLLIAVLSFFIVSFTGCSENIYNPSDQNPSGSSQEQLSILFIGNSFTIDAVTHLPGLLDAAGIKNVQ